MKHTSNTATQIDTTIRPPAPQAPQAPVKPSHVRAVQAQRSKSTPPPAPQQTRAPKQRRSLAEMIEAQPTWYSEAAYASQRIAASELRIAQILSTIGPEARAHILATREDLARYVPPM